MASHEIVQLLLKITLASSAACALVLLLRGPVRRRWSAGAAYGLWAMVPLVTMAVLLPAPRTAVVVAGTSTPVRLLAEIPVLPPVGLDRADALVLVWGLGALLMACLLCWQQRRFVRALGPLRQRADGCWQGADVPGLPALVGVLRPRIVVPAGFDTRYSGEEQSLIVLHERIHLHRGDAWINALVALWRCLFWFNPLWGPAQRCLRLDQEFSCDEAVIARRGDARRPYASAMLKTSLALSPLPVGCHWQDIHPLKERIVMLKRPQQAVGKRRVNLLLIAGGVMLASTLAWAAQPARPVSDTGQDKERIKVEVDALGSATEPAQVREMSAPIYPSEAFAQGKKGKVMLEIDVGVDGKPTAVTVVEAEPAGVFEANTVASAWKWQFKPSMDNGRAVAGKVRVPVWFDLDETTHHDQ